MPFQLSSVDEVPILPEFNYENKTQKIIFISLPHPICYVIIRLKMDIIIGCEKRIEFYHGKCIGITQNCTDISQKIEEVLPTLQRNSKIGSDAVGRNTNWQRNTLSQDHPRLKK